MPSLTAAQRAIADAYAQVFAPGRQCDLVLDDLTVFANARQEALERAGAISVLGYIFQQRSRVRRMKAREET